MSAADGKEHPYRVLIVDDDVEQAEMLREFLRLSGFNEVAHAPNIYNLWRLLDEEHFDIIVLDYKLPDGTGLDALDQLKQRGFEVPVVMVTGQGNERIAVEAMQRGAAEYLIKSGDYLVTLPATIRKTLRAFQLQQSVKRSLDQIRYQAMLLNNVRDAIVVWDMSGRITYWNPAAAHLFGWSADERLGRPVAQYYLPAFTPSIVPPKEDMPSQHIVRKFTNREGKTVWVSSRLSALRDTQAGNRLIGYMDVLHDITRRVEAEQALRESEARYRAIVEDYQTEMICRFKPNGTLTYVNEMFCEYFGKTRQELIGMNYLFFVPETERQRMIQHLVSFNPAKPVSTMEHLVNIPSKGMRWLQRTDRAILDEQGHIFEFQSMERDITDHKNMEAQIRAAQTQLVQAARLTTIGEMASGVAHQIYNPLTTIIADAQILLRSLPPDGSGRDSAEAIEQAGWRLQQVVQRLMEFSRPSTDSLTSFSVNDTIHRALGMVSTHIETSGCRLDVQLGEALPPLLGHPRQLENVWVNLLLLARDACTDGIGHTICIQSRLESSMSGPREAIFSGIGRSDPAQAIAADKSSPAGANRLAQNSYVVVEVRDDGKTIPAEQLAIIFEPNFIGATIGRGTGLELSICREIVRQHGGQIVAESAPDRDTIFRVTLPVEV